jgi:hypothetical protein
MPPNSKSAAVKHTTALASSGSVRSPKIKQRQNVDAFLLDRKNVILEPNIFAPLLSINPNTDAVLDHFKIGDEVILKLHDLIVTMHSSHWEVVLRSPKLDLTYEQAVNLIKALHVDLSGAPLSNLKNVWISMYLLNETELYACLQTSVLLSVLLKVLGMLVFICALRFFGLVLMF